MHICISARMTKLFYSNKLKFSVTEYITIYFSPNAGLQETLFIVVTQQSRLWWFYLDHVSTTIVVGGRTTVNLTLAVTSCAWKWCIFLPQVSLDRASNKIMPNFKGNRRTRNMVNRTNASGSIKSLYVWAWICDRK